MTDQVPKQDNEISDIARRLAAQRQILEGHCEICGKAFIGTKKKRYCSHNCAQKAYIRSKAEKGANDGK